jgi:hypothetical protein
MMNQMDNSNFNPYQQQMFGYQNNMNNYNQNYNQFSQYQMQGMNNMNNIQQFPTMEIGSQGYMGMNMSNTNFNNEYVDSKKQFNMRNNK